MSDWRTSADPRIDYRVSPSFPAPVATIAIVAGKIYLGSFLLLPASKTIDIAITRSVIAELLLIGQNAR